MRENDLKLLLPIETDREAQLTQAEEDQNDEPLKNHIRRKSCCCTFCGEMRIKHKGFDVIFAHEMVSVVKLPKFKFQFGKMKRKGFVSNHRFSLNILPEIGSKIQQSFSKQRGDSVKQSLNSVRSNPRQSKFNQNNENKTKVLSKFADWNQIVGVDDSGKLSRVSIACYQT
uniref:Uncharacterized protein n=1 Tax=Euplotes harpa TaxID=151035 RepID=A0A7S3IZJ5_9SPIT